MEISMYQCYRMLVLGLAVLGAAAAHAQTDAYPNKPIRLIVPFPPGASVDITARQVAGKLEDRLKQPLVADNIGGAAGVIATETAARAAPNGYTLLFGTRSAMVLARVLNDKLTYHPVTDFQPISQVVSNPQVVLVSNSTQVNSVAEFIALAKREPGKLNFGSSGSGAASHIGGEMFKSMTGIDIVHVPYKGAAQSQIDLIRGRIHLYIGSIPGQLGGIKAGKFKAVAVTSKRRSAALPGVPTMTEAGFPDYEHDAWYAIFAPAKTGRAIVNRLNTELLVVLSEPELVKSMASQGAELHGTTPEGLGSLVRNDYERMRKVIESIGPISK
jgi:tripartite-type tricarboxylate transporter receptor subunit TctC